MLISPQLPVEAFAVAVFPGNSWFDVQCLFGDRPLTAWLAYKGEPLTFLRADRMPRRQTPCRGREAELPLSADGLPVSRLLQSRRKLVLALTM